VLVACLRDQASIEASGFRITTADRSFGAGLAGAVNRGELRAPVLVRLHGAAGQSFGAFLPEGIDVRLTGQANDYVGKGLSGGTVTVVPEAGLTTPGTTPSVAGNTCLYGATGGRVHLVGRAGMRFGVRNSGAEAVVEGVGPHGCEYMTGGVVAVLGSVGPNFGAGMTGGHAYIHDPDGRALAAINASSVTVTRLSATLETADGRARLAELHRLVERHAAAGSAHAERLLADANLAADTWLVEPDPVVVAEAAPAPARRVSPAVTVPGSAPVA
jgi:glutamate synthase domain-containing protein 3